MPCQWNYQSLRIRQPDLQRGANGRLFDAMLLLVDGMLKADGAVMTAISDDTIGGDTDMNGDAHPFVYQAFNIMGDEENISMDGCVNKIFSGVSIANAQGSSELCRLDVRM